MAVHITLLKPGEGHVCAKDDVLVEMSPVNCNSIEEDREFWEESGESPAIVIGHLVLDNLPEEIEDYIEELRLRDGPDMLEHILTTVFNLGRAFPA